MRKKRILSAVISAAMAFGFMSYMPQTEVFEPMTAEAVSYSDNIAYGDYLTIQKVDEENDGTYDYVEISGCDKSVTEIDIPSQIEGLPVTSIANGIFSWCTSLTDITIPDSITSIGKDAFNCCSKLTSINVMKNNNNFNSIDGILFNKEQTKIIAYPAGKTEISYTIPDGVTSIESSAFTYCHALTDIIIPDSVTSIGDYAFSVCESLKNITIPESVTNIGANVFISTPWLNSKKKENPLVIVNNILVNGSSCSDNVVISDDVTSIADYAFSFNSRITSVTIPDSVKSIGDYAFYNCDKLESVTIQNGVTSIGKCAFFICYHLKSVIIPESVKSIGEFAFNETWLESITIKNPDCEIFDSEGTITDDATIYGYSDSTAHTYAEKYDREFISLGEAPVITTTITTEPNETTQTTISAIDETTNSSDSSASTSEAPVVTTTTTTTSSTVSEITESSETETGSATKTDISEVTTTETSVSSATTTTTTVTTTQQTTISGEIYNDLLVYKKVDTDNDEKYDYIEIIDCSPSAVSVEIPDKIDGLPVTSIGNDAFKDCKSLESVTIPEAVTNIGNSAFEYCTSLKNISIPEGITIIKYHAFADCESLESITIPQNVTIIEDYAFLRCNALTSITIPKNVESIADNAFWFCESITDFNVDKNNSFYTDIDGVMFNKEQTVLVAYPIGRKDKSYPIPDSVTRIENHAFSGSDTLESITFHNNITEIGDYAFSNCWVLTNVIFSESVINIGGHAFSHTPWLEAKQAENPLVIVNNILIDGETCSGDITIPADVIVIGKKAFYGCETLTGITIGNDVASIEEFAFAYCDSLETVTISKNALSIACFAFTDCKSLKSVTIESPYCYINDSSYTINNGYAENGGNYYDGIIYGYSDSTAQEYAEKNGYKFESLGKAPAVKPSTSTECDANGDGETNIRDAAAIATALAKGQLDKLSLAADFNGDGKVNIRDAAALASALAKGEI